MPERLIHGADKLAFQHPQDRFQVMAALQDLAVDPDHRLVARNLEQDWNARLAAVEQLEREYAALPTLAIPPLGDRERARIRALADDLPALWQTPTTPWQERKQVCGC